MGTQDVAWEGYKPFDEMKAEQEADLIRRGYQPTGRRNEWRHPLFGLAIATDKPGPREWDYRREGLPLAGPLEQFTSLVVEYPH
ncbi:MAG: hypothetical protein SFW09_13380 [Hyphomicrobiaceae bacterium]|nr:hypothetical protein [Hyphomicrobiaceae bacterium]